MKDLLIAILLGDDQQAVIPQCGRRLADVIEIGLAERYLHDRRIRLTELGREVVRAFGLPQTEASP